MSSDLVVEAPLFDPFVEKFKAKTATIKMDDPRDPDTVIGPLIRARQCGFIDGQLESGMAHVNDTMISDEPHVPFGGVKNSDAGREGGHYSLEELTKLKWVTIQMGKRMFSF